MSIKIGVVGMVPTESIVIEDRARKEMGDLDSLESNMKESGLIAPLAVYDNGDGTYRLLAGERRFTILKRNGAETIPARIYDYDLSEIEMKVIEKSENFYRKDMEYWEFDALTLEITRLQQAEKGVRASGPSKSGWSLSDTGEMIGKDKATVSQAIRRAEIREQYPELFDKCKTAADATKVLKRMEEAVVKDSIARDLEEKKSESVPVQLGKQFIIKSFFEGIKEVPDSVFHMVEIDPPYAIDLREQKKSNGESQYELKDYNEIERSTYMDGDGESWLGMKEVLHQCYRTMATHSWLVCWFGPEPWFEEMYNAITGAGFETTRMVGIWAKGTGQTNNPNIRLANAYEMFFYAWKGQPALNKPGSINLFTVPSIQPQDKTHPTERPIDLMHKIYETFAFPGSRILIPFLGSGNGILAAYKLGLTAIGFELSKGYKDSFLVKAHNMYGK